MRGFVQPEPDLLVHHLHLPLHHRHLQVPGRGEAVPALSPSTIQVCFLKLDFTTLQLKEPETDTTAAVVAQTATTEAFAPAAGQCRWSIDKLQFFLEKGENE